MTRAGWNADPAVVSVVSAIGRLRASWTVLLLTAHLHPCPAIQVKPGAGSTALCVLRSGHSLSGLSPRG
jgi:hypothetical protein